jgi:hypothetical protein
MKVNCLCCGHAVDLRDGYDDYDGQIKCFACGSLLAIRTREGQVKWVELAEHSAARSGVDASFEQ